MSTPDSPDHVAIRNFAIWTEHAAKLLHCSYADAAVFMTKFGQLILLTQDATFQAQLAQYTKAAAGQPLPSTTPPSPEGKSVH